MPSGHEHEVEIEMTKLRDAIAALPAGPERDAVKRVYDRLRGALAVSGYTLPAA